MIENAKLDRLLTQVNCRITNIPRLKDAGAISERKAELAGSSSMKATQSQRIFISAARALPLAMVIAASLAAVSQ